MSDNLYLFANNNGGQAEGNGSYRLYDMKIEGDSEGVGSGVDYVNYLDSDGNCSIDTGLPFNSSYKYVFNMYTLEYISSAIFSSNNFTYNAVTNNLKYGTFYGFPSYQGNEVNHRTAWRTDNLLKVFDNGKYYIGNELISSVTSNQSSGNNVTLFGNSVSRLRQYQVYNGDELIQDLRPCLDTKGVPCMYDEVSKKYLYNQGTGTFKYKKTIRDFQPVLDSNNVPCLLDKINNKFYYNKSGEVFKTKEKPKYKKLKYLIGGGDNCIDLGQRTVDSNTKIKTKVENVDDNRCCVFQFDNSNNFRYLLSGSGHMIYYNGNWIPLDKKLEQEFNLNEYGFTYNGVIYLFKISRINTDYAGKSKIYYFQMYQSNQLTLDLIPVLDQNNVPCMYDKVSDQFFYNQGTGTFGYEIEELDVPQIEYIKYIQGDGSSWIDTGIVPKSNYTIDTEFCVVDLVEHTEYLFGNEEIAGASYSRGGIGLAIRQDKVSYVENGSAGSPFYGKNVLYNGQHMNKYVQFKHKFESIYDKTYTLVVLGNRSSSAVNGVGMLCKDKVRISYFKIYNESEKLLIDLRPCLDTQGVPCMYDEVSKKYFYNKGTGQFSYGERITYTETEYIESTGTQYIDTGVVPNSNTDIDMTSRLSAMPYYFSGWKTQVNIKSLTESFVIELDLKYSGSQTGAGSIIPSYLYVLSDGCYSLNGTDTTSVKVSTNKYDKVKIIANIGDKKEYVYINNKLIGEKAISELLRISFGGSHNNYSGCYTHHIDIYKLSDMSLLYSLRPVINNYYWSGEDYIFKVPMLYDEINSQYYHTSYGDNWNYTSVNYGYDDNYIYNKLKTLNKYSIQNSESASYKKTVYDKTVYEYNGVDITIQPNLVASKGATLTMGSVNLAKLNDDDIEIATNNGWSLI